MKGGIKIKAMEKILLNKELNLIKKEKELKKKEKDIDFRAVELSKREKIIDEKTKELKQIMEELEKLKRKTKISIENKIGEKEENQEIEKKNDEDANKKKEKFDFFVDNDYPNIYSDEMNENHINKRDNGNKDDAKNEKYSSHINGKNGEEGDKD